MEQENPTLPCKPKNASEQYCEYESREGQGGAEESVVVEKLL